MSVEHVEAVPVAEPVGARAVIAQLRMWFEMTRPRVLVLVLFTGLPMLGMCKEGWPSFGTAMIGLFATALAGAASSTLNAWYERESDARMARTRNRPLPASAVAPGQALWLGIGLTVVSTAVLWAVGGALAAALGLGTVLFYVLGYTVYLKPRTPQNIVIGGAAGATTPMILEAVIDGRVSAASFVLFLIVFLWTPPHFWAIAIFRKKDYAAAGFPMMPNVIGDVATRRQSLVYAVLTVVASLSLVPLGLLGVAYGVAAAAAGVWFVLEVVRSQIADDPRYDWRVFKVSIAYLFVVFGAMLVDSAARSLFGPLPSPMSLLGLKLAWLPVI